MMKEKDAVTNAITKGITILGTGIVLAAVLLIAHGQQQNLKIPKLPLPKPTPGATPKGPVIRPGHLVLPDEAIPQKYGELGGTNGVLGKPVTGLTRCPDGVGYFIHYEHGSIYWSGATGAHEVHGAIYDKWASLGWETFFGYPITDEVRAPDGVGRINHFQINGSIYWTPTTGAREVHGYIREEWKSLNWEHSFLGYPISDESTTPDGVGRYNQFQGGTIYWTPNTGAHEVHGPIFAKWKSMGWETSYLAYPISDMDGNNVQQFQRGTIQMSSSGVAVDIPATKTFHVGVSFDGGTPVGGTVDLVVDAKGNYKWHGHLHDSGFPDYSFALATVLVTKSALSFPNWWTGTVHGTASFGGDRDDNYDMSGTDQRIADNWDQIDQTGRLYWKITTQDTISQGIKAWVEQVVKDAIKQCTDHPEQCIAAAAAVAG
jgi:uncharacterized protein with LGFP repeats